MFKAWVFKFAFIMTVAFVSAQPTRAQTPEPPPGEAILQDLRKNLAAYTAPREVNLELQVNSFDQIENERHSEVKIEVLPEKIVVQFNVDKLALAYPHLMVANIAKLQNVFGTWISSYLYCAGGFSVHAVLSNAETSKNAQLGSPTAKARLIEMELNRLNHTTVYETYPGGASLAEEQLKNEREKMHATLVDLEAMALKHTKSQQKKIDRWRSENKVLEKYEAMDEKLNDLILNNDRKAVARMIEAYLPWAVMEPVEAESWRVWLNAIEKPDLTKTTVAFRGIDYDTDKIQRRQTPQGEVFGFMSTILTKNQGNYTRRLRSLSTNRLKNGDLMARENSPYKSIKIADQMQAHASDPVASNFLSFTFHPEIATAFGGKNKNGKPNGGLLAVRIDSRRLIPNIISDFGEFELLAPLIIFPDEVVRYQEGVFSVHMQEYKDFVQDISNIAKIEFSKIKGHDLKDIMFNENKSLHQNYSERGLKFFTEVLGKVSARQVINSCSKVML